MTLLLKWRCFTLLRSECSDLWTSCLRLLEDEVSVLRILTGVCQEVYKVVKN